MCPPGTVKGILACSAVHVFVPKPDHLVDPESGYDISRSDHLWLKT